MGETGRSLGWRWVMLIMSLGFALAWPSLRPQGMMWTDWALTLWVAGLVWLAWSTKNWLLGVITGIFAIFHPRAALGHLEPALVKQLASLTLAAAWCAQFGELFWHPQAGWKSWLSWTAVGCTIALALAPQDMLLFILAQSVIWLACVTLVAMWWQHPTATKTWRKLAGLLSVVVVSIAALSIHLLIHGSQGTPLRQMDWRHIYDCWHQAMEMFWPWPGRLGGTWFPTVFLLWGWWRTARRAWLCARQGNPPAAIVLTWSAPLMVWHTLAQSSPSALVPFASLLLGYLFFDVFQHIFERMRLEPPAQQRVERTAHKQ